MNDDGFVYVYRTLTHSAVRALVLYGMRYSFLRIVGRMIVHARF
jgi:hypothetical protein